MAMTFAQINPNNGALPRPADITAGGRKRNRYTCTADNNYPTGGYPVLPANVGLGEQIDFIDVVNENITAWTAVFNKATQKIQFVVMSTGAEVANATDIHTASVDIIAEGL